MQEFKSDVLDLQDKRIYRDLSKPIGALNAKRLKEFEDRYLDMPLSDRYLYGTHYSCPGYVIGFLVRKHPWWMIRFQGGKFDNPNRLFKGIKKEWESGLENQGNVKELIPEFFMDESEDSGAFLVNSLKIDFGKRHNNKIVDDVKLPKWATDEKDFIRKQRAALESDYVSQNLHLWINLIFGCYQRSEEHKNVFHPMTYEGSLDPNALLDPI